jgi:rubrerythrin
MSTEQADTLKILKTAIQMELDGREFYLKASRASTSDLGRKLLQSLADEESIHQQKFEEIYREIEARGGWPVVTFQPDGGQALRTIFAEATETITQVDTAQTTEIDAVQMAVDMEAKSYDFYQEQLEAASHDAEREFYRALAAQEREHQLILLDYFEYLKDPAAWFVTKEHHSLDGG